MQAMWKVRETAAEGEVVRIVDELVHELVADAAIKRHPFQWCSLAYESLVAPIPLQTDAK
jgi:hypothetical protein